MYTLDNRPSFKRTALQLFVLIVVLSLAGRGRAQNTGETQTDASKLPDAVRLAVRGKVGDKYQFQSRLNYKVDFGATSSDGSPLQSGSESGSEKGTFIQTVRALGPTGKITFVIRTLAAEEIAVENGRSKMIHGPLKTMRLIVAPNGQELSKTTLSIEGAGSNKRSHQANTDASVGISLFSLGFTFPDKVLQVGDTWEGTLKADKEDRKSGLGDMSYTGTLDAIEMHRGVPCAKVMFTPQLNDLFDKLLLQDLRKNFNVTGGAKTSGAFTVYYTLDRGMQADLTADVRVEGDYDLTSTSDSTQQMKMKATLSITGNETATQFPPYVSRLVVTQ